VASVLDRILAHKRNEIEALRTSVPLSDVRAQARDAPPPQDLLAALREGALPRPRVIAEIKRRSPSGGELRKHTNAVEIAQQYMLAGAAALPVVTDIEFFGGSLLDLAAVRTGTRLPVLRKDFILDPYQVWRSRAVGADAILLIVAAHEDSERLVELHGLILELGMTPLVEVHTAPELEIALAAGARLIGVNHRDLRTLDIDMTLTARLRPQVPREVTLVAESGIKTADDVRRLGASGADAVLVGETLMRAPDPGAALKELMAGCS